MSQEAKPAAREHKQTLRRQFRTRRRSLALERDRSADAKAIAATAGTILDTLPLQPCVAIYRSLPSEPPTDALAEMLHARGAMVIVPEMLPDKDLDWHELRDGIEGARLGLEGIAAAVLILVPALAVDLFGTRLGQGGGSYDRALARRHPDALVVAVVNDDESGDWSLPHEAHDVRVDAVITPRDGLSLIPVAGSVT